MAHREQDLQLMLNDFSQSLQAFCLSISLLETEVLLQAAPNTTPKASAFSVDGAVLTNI